MSAITMRDTIPLRQKNCRWEQDVCVGPYENLIRLCGVMGICFK